jgi:MFS family permease
MSHGTQDQYTTFLKEQHHASADLPVLVAVIYNIGAMLGGVVMGGLSEFIGRRRTVVTCALLALPIVPLFAFPSNIALLTALVTWLGPENRGASFGETLGPAEGALRRRSRVRERTSAG